jgi:RNA polymerase sigma-70 factor (ECF subfamily)
MSAFDEVYQQHLRAVFRYAVRLLGRRDIAEELTSDAFIALWRNFDSIKRDELPGWLFAVVRNRATDYWRRSGVEQKYLAGLPSEPVSATAEVDAFRESLDAAPDLKPVHRAVLILRYVHGMERGEIAARLGLTEMQVKGLMQYAHRLLRREYVEDE